LARQRSPRVVIPSSRAPIVTPQIGAVATHGPWGLTAAIVFNTVAAVVCPGPSVRPVRL
jgi:hypothetical protein